MPRTLSDEDVEAIASRLAVLIQERGPLRTEPGAAYTVDQAARLVSMHPETLREKLRARIVEGKRRGGGS